MRFDFLFQKGALAYEQAALERLGLPVQSAEILSRWGLPRFEEKEPPLGIVFHEARLLRAHSGHIAIGREVWEESLYITVDTEAGIVWAVTEPGQDKPVYMNSSVASLLSFMELTLRFKKQTDSLEPEPPPAVWTAAQMQEKLEKLRNGELRPVRNPEAEQARRQWSAAFRELTRELKTHDPQAVRASSWWGIVLDEMRDGLR